MKIFSVLLICGLIAFSVYQGVQIYRTLKEKKNAKSKIKGDNEDGRDCGC